MGRARALGMGGIGAGGLGADGGVEVESMRRLLSPAAGLPFTFHKAFDLAANLREALEQVIELGATRVLTSGGAATALDGAAAIAALVDQAGERISVMAAGKIRDNNVRDVIARAHVREVHSRFVDEADIRSLVRVPPRNSPSPFYRSHTPLP